MQWIMNLCSTLLKGKEQLLYLADGRLSHLTISTWLIIQREEGLASGYDDSRDLDCPLYHRRCPIHITYEPPKLQRHTVLWLSSPEKLNPLQPAGPWKILCVPTCRMGMVTLPCFTSMFLHREKCKRLKYSHTIGAGQGKITLHRTWGLRSHQTAKSMSFN